jgi:hypothetical protein
MSEAIQYLIVALILLTPDARVAGVENKSLLEIEKPGIDKIAQFSAKEHSTILFAIADHLIGYARDGHIDWISSNHDSGRVACAWPHPALSHDGLRVAFVSDRDKPKRCRIVAQDMRRGVQRGLIETADDPGEISWSWDDTEIAFFDHGILAVSVGNGVKRVLLSSPLERIGGREFTFGVWYPMQWLHNDRDLVVELGTEIPTKEPGTYTVQSDLLLVSGGKASIIEVGSNPAVSPISDRIAYYASDGIVAINQDATGRTVLGKAPSAIVFGKDELFWNIVWSPDANRLFFGTIISKNRRDNLYLLDVKSGHREQFLSHTSITIRGWH